MSKQGKELVQAAREAVAHARGRIKLKEFRADMTDEERELLLQEICAAEPQESTETDSMEDKNDSLPSRSRQSASRRTVTASGRSRWRGLLQPR